MQKPDNKLEVIQTADGSHTLFHPNLNEHYHSKNGSISESMHVFIKMGLQYKGLNKSKLRILEVGFGTGLNALLSFMYGGEIVISYTALEPFPLNKELIKQLNYIELLSIESDADFINLHECEWNSKYKLNANFELLKCKTRLEDFNTNERFDLVYFDAFAPRPQPELWDKKIFVKLFGLMDNNAVLVTYCAKGQVRRNMQEAGFTVQRLEGPPGKREMLRASKHEEI